MPDDNRQAISHLEDARDSAREVVAKLEETGNVGVWQRSTDDGDNRERARLLRDAKWAGAHLQSHVEDAAPLLPAHAERCRALLAQCDALVAQLDPLVSLINVRVDPNRELDAACMSARELAESMDATIGELIALAREAVQE